ncbi:hypothetical protein H6F90_16735 [Trichocoleus sp. FACHB-591]|uniref:hypothetical protein n=1 Tax=Trichocoleus sp. FACHB-591 TaxID=2692872 RepID=UPI001683AB5F|nr:hypothetical protein [Trichocoleus sp. FACHB-591]MBD2096751.1 hypothetical protein [Trichocoleus sp. FACHB-591]
MLESEGLEIWASIHAWRSLGRLRAEAAIEPLLSLLHRMDDEGNAWIGEELPEVFGMIGAVAIMLLVLTWLIKHMGFRHEPQHLRLW